MKRILILTLAVSLFLLTAVSALAAVHPSREEMVFDLDWGFIFTSLNIASAKEEWYSTLPTESYLLGAIDYSDDTKIYGIYYYQNPQTFVEVSDFFIGDHSLATWNLKGGYLFDFGLFAGVNYYTNEYAEETIMSLGYRFSWEEDNYLALSADYNSDEEVYGYDLDLAYYPEQAKIFGQVYEVEDEDPIITLGANYQFSDSLTGGLRGDWQDDGSRYAVGITWTNEQWVVNAALGNEDIITFGSYYAAGFFYKFTESVMVGADYINYEDLSDPIYVYKFHYKTDNFTLALHYLVDNPGTP